MTDNPPGGLKPFKPAVSAQLIFTLRLLRRAKRITKAVAYMRTSNAERERRQRLFVFQLTAISSRVVELNARLFN
jgi:hypothetical protein